MTNSKSPDHLPDKEREPYLTLGLKLVSLAEVGLFIIAMYHLGFVGSGLLGWAKLLLLGFAAYLVSYLIYRLAIERGATLNSVGYRFAGVLSGATVALVGIAFFLATVPGLTITQVEERRLTDHLAASAGYVDQRIAKAARTADVVPVILAIAQDAAEKAACERATSCVSNRGNGGAGPVSRALETLAGRATGIAAQMEAGLDRRDEVEQDVATLVTHMDETLGVEARDIWERRAQLRKHDNDLSRLLQDLDAAVPGTLAKAYAIELRGGIEIPNRPEVSATINRILSGYAATIDAALAGPSDAAPERPVFPARTGAMDTFAYWAEFAPIFVIAFLIDLTFPLALWAYTLMGLDWDRYTRRPDPARGQREATDMDRITGHGPLDLSDRPDRSDARKRPTRRNTNH